MKKHTPFKIVPISQDRWNDKEFQKQLIEYNTLEIPTSSDAVLIGETLMKMSDSKADNVEPQLKK